MRRASSERAQRVQRALRRRRAVRTAYYRPFDIRKAWTANTTNARSRTRRHVPPERSALSQVRSYTTNKTSVAHTSPERRTSRCRPSGRGRGVHPRIVLGASRENGRPSRRLTTELDKFAIYLDDAYRGGPVHGRSRHGREVVPTPQRCLSAPGPPSESLSPELSLHGRRW